MKIIKAASIYKATLPESANLAIHLEEKAFIEMQPSEAQSIGFVPRESGELVTEFPGGFAFQVRVDEKIIPGPAVSAEVRKRAKAIQTQYGRKPGKKEIKEIKDEVILCFRLTALTRTAIIPCFYCVEKEYLIIPTTSKKMCDLITSVLIHAVGSVKTQTIHVSDAKQGLTTRLQSWLNGDNDAFGKFHPEGDVKLKTLGETLTIKMGSLQTANKGLQEAISKGFVVESIGLSWDATGFRLTSDFRFQSISFGVEPPEEDTDLWVHEASVQVLNLSAVLTELCDMLGYKPPVDENEVEIGGVAA